MHTAGRHGITACARRAASPVTGRLSRASASWPGWFVPLAALWALVLSGGMRAYEAMETE